MPLSKRRFSLGKTLLVLLLGWLVIDVAWESDAEREQARLAAEAKEQKRLAEEAAARAEAERWASLTPVEREAELEAKRAAEAARRKAAAELAQRKRCNGERTMAYTMSKEFVKRSLKSPSTAEFPWMTNDQVDVRWVGGENGECKYQVLAFVDAQNGFGALIRTRYRADLATDGDQWKLTNLVM